MSNTSLPDFTDANFQSEVLQSPVPVLVSFTAEWCGPCKMLAPELVKFSARWPGQVKVGHFDIDENPQMTAQLQVMGLPTMILFKGGQPVQRLAGFMRVDELAKKLKAHLPMV